MLLKYNFMNNLQRIDYLLEQWKELHNNENKESYIKTAPVDKNGNSPEYDMFKSSFCPDGYLGWGKESYVLFICKESNVNGIASDGSFWLHEVVCARLKGQKYRDANYSDNKEKKRIEQRKQSILIVLIQLREFCSMNQKMKMFFRNVDI